MKQKIDSFISLSLIYTFILNLCNSNLRILRKNIYIYRFNTNTNID